MQTEEQRATGPQVVDSWRKRAGLPESYPLNSPTHVEKAMQGEISDLRTQLVAQGELRTAVRDMATMLQNREWANLLTTDADAAALDAEISKLVDAEAFAASRRAPASDRTTGGETKPIYQVRRKPMHGANFDWRDVTEERYRANYVADEWNEKRIVFLAAPTSDTAAAPRPKRLSVSAIRQFALVHASAASGGEYYEFNPEGLDAFAIDIMDAVAERASAPDSSATAAGLDITNEDVRMLHAVAGHMRRNESPRCSDDLTRLALKLEQARDKQGAQERDSSQVHPDSALPSRITELQAAFDTGPKFGSVQVGRTVCPVADTMDHAQLQALGEQQVDWAARGFVVGATVENAPGQRWAGRGVITCAHRNGALDVIAHGVAYGWNARNCVVVKGGAA